MELNPTRWDWELMVFLNNSSPDALNVFWSFVTYTENWIPFYLLLLALFFYKSELKKSFVRILLLVLSVGITHLITELVKNLVERPRPNVTEEIMNSIKILYEPSNYSFFSGHASTSFAATVFIFLLLKSKFKYLGSIFIWPVLFSLSRIFVGVHFPSDIIVGGCVGTLIAILFFKFYSNSESKLLSVSNQNNT
ncbi:phosphatase PAP2 family protein [Psychroflexus lacisalsi]|jgi:undecaprenyl-diphosphatase|uniref:phosphatase PAP2 family protein n=1 Tax=Psychroflexus lacisalsi TaxID=503928 RepID=UPI001CCB5442|nr:phosphatase PAP2 family protein [Psychroflexus lacisalsi]MBZ9619300.1 phosphatase PAP2 family protein [Psychroflexus lacisalsi]